MPATECREGADDAPPNQETLRMRVQGLGPELLYPETRTLPHISASRLRSCMEKRAAPAVILAGRPRRPVPLAFGELAATQDGATFAGCD